MADLLAKTAALIEMHQPEQASATAYLEAANEIRHHDAQALPSGNHWPLFVRQDFEAMLNGQEPEALSCLCAQTPSDLLVLLEEGMLGARRLHHLWKELGIEKLPELNWLLAENRLSKARGFGEKTQAKLRESLKQLRLKGATFRQSDLQPYADQLLLDLQNHMPKDCQIQIVGDFRAKRKYASKLEVCISSDAYRDCMIMLVRLPHYELCGASQNSLSALLRDTQVKVEFSFHSEDFALAAFSKTGAYPHVRMLSLEANGHRSEADIYSEFGLQYVPADLREDKEALLPQGQRMLGKLVQATQIRGLFNTKSRAGDGQDELEALAHAAMALGFEYLVISDHAPGSANGMGISEAGLKAQQTKIVELNAQLAPFKLFQGLEVDILAEGELAASDALLASVDWIIAALPRNSRLSANERTRRLRMAASKGKAHILAHPLGKLAEEKGYIGSEIELVAAACAKSGTVLEINCHPDREDLDWETLKALDADGLMFSIDPEAHASDELLNFQFGISTARKAWLQPRQILNCLSLQELQNWMANRQEGR